MSPAEILRMPSSLFWSMEACIVRIMAEQDLRNIGVRQSTTSQDTLDSHKKNLVLQMGEIYVIKRTHIVKGERGAMDKLKNLM